MASKLTTLCRLGNATLKTSQRCYSAAAGEAHHGSAGKWRTAFFVLGLPAVGLVWYNAYYVMPQHPEREEFVPYEHLRVRVKQFPWGDGNHSLFHNGYYNALPEGYEEGSEKLHGGHH